MTLIKVKHPIFAPGESREVTGGARTHHSCCCPDSPAPLQGRPGGPHGRGGMEPNLPEGRADPNTLSLLSQPSLAPPPRRCRLLTGRGSGPPRRPPPRPAPRCGGEPGALLPSAAGCTPGSVSPRGPSCPGDIGGQRYQPRECSSCGFHPAALLRMPGAVLGVFQLWVPPALTKPPRVTAKAEAPHLCG